MIHRQIMTFFQKAVVVITSLICWANAQWDPNFQKGRDTIVHLFEWKWNDIASECERFLGPKGFGGVQISPPNENAVLTTPNRPWYERYQPVSYKLVTRSGNEEEFAEMVTRCNKVGVRIYVDAVINHMTGNDIKGKGTGGSEFDGVKKSYPDAGYTEEDFNGKNTCATNSGKIEDYSNADQVRNCELSGLRDLNQNKENVRQKIAWYMNKLIGLGVAGFRIDASKHMWPEDLEVILGRLSNLSVKHGFEASARPFIVQEVIDTGNEPIKGSDYFKNGRVTELRYGIELAGVMRKLNNQQMRWLKNYGEGWGMYPDKDALVFIDNHDNQRGHGAGGTNILTFRVPKLYKMAQAFMLAWPYGVPRVMSSYSWDEDIQDGKDRNDWMGPPHNKKWEIEDVAINNDGSCGGGWVCEHRWRPIYSMVSFRNVVKGTNVTSWWDNGKDQIAFSRGNRGFIAINNDNKPLYARIKTDLPSGKYCDIISGDKLLTKCTGKTITVSYDGTLKLYIGNTEENPMIALHAESKL